MTYLDPTQVAAVAELADALERHRSEPCPEPHPALAAKGKTGHWYRGSDMLHPAVCTGCGTPAPTLENLT